LLRQVKIHDITPSSGVTFTPGDKPAQWTAHSHAFCGDARKARSCVHQNSKIRHTAYCSMATWTWHPITHYYYPLTIPPTKMPNPMKSKGRLSKNKKKAPAKSPTLRMLPATTFPAADASARASKDRVEKILSDMI